MELFWIGLIARKLGSDRSSSALVPSGGTSLHKPAAASHAWGRMLWVRGSEGMLWVRGSEVCVPGDDRLRR